MAELYVQNEYWIAVFQLSLAMLGMGATLRIADFKEIALGWFTPRLLKLNRPDSTAIEIEVGLRNVNLGVMIKASVFPAVAAPQK